MGGGLGLPGRTRVSARRGSASHLVLLASFGVPPVPQRQGSAGGTRPRPPQSHPLLLRFAAVAIGGAVNPISARPGISCSGRHLYFLSRDLLDRRVSAGHRNPTCSYRSTSPRAPGSQGSLSRRLTAPSDRVN
ncbi:hypothetical protein NDU88_006019 [Pleurodeles waltl]|uniref:Uncharacterized protein n=1 Tax=Pleurodeles waltl TaxID=8319 RepID=A0AAV7NWX9_PLEWA|nr:hypothetical protein NDU88_006019 [Pleurodeles waltl]